MVSRGGLLAVPAKSPSSVISSESSSESSASPLVSSSESVAVNLENQSAVSESLVFSVSFQANQPAEQLGVLQGGTGREVHDDKVVLVYNGDLVYNQPVQSALCADSTESVAVQSAVSADSTESVTVESSACADILESAVQSAPGADSTGSPLILKVETENQHSNHCVQSAVSADNTPLQSSFTVETVESVNHVSTCAESAKTDSSAMPLSAETLESFVQVIKELILVDRLSKGSSIWEECPTFNFSQEKRLLNLAVKKLSAVPSSKEEAVKIFMFCDSLLVQKIAVAKTIDTRNDLFDAIQLCNYWSDLKSLLTLLEHFKRSYVFGERAEKLQSVLPSEVPKNTVNSGLEHSASQSEKQSSVSTENQKKFSTCLHFIFSYLARFNQPSRRQQVSLRISRKLCF